MIRKKTAATFLVATVSMVLMAVAAEKPNILFIFADDQCYDSISALGNREVITPNLDRLVDRGVVFTHAYNMGAWNGAVCVASRAMLNTGKFVWRARAALADYEQEGLMWSQRMRQAGYETCMAGKWHVSVKAERIFNKTGSVRPGMPNQTPDGYNRPLSENDKKWLPWDKKRDGFWKGGKHWSEVLADETIGFLEASADSEKPFFIYAAFNAPHDPRQSPKKFVDMYPLSRISSPVNFMEQYPFKDKIGCSEKLRDERLAPFPRTEYAVKVNRQEYYAIITHMDAQIGRILDALERSGKADNTYVFFTADHGLACGQHGLMGKQNMYEHSLRAPFIACGPSLKGGRRVATPIYLQDVMPTALELAGASRDKVEFKSLCPLLAGTRTEHYDAIYAGYLNLQRAIVQNGFKLIHYPEAGVYRLFDLTHDRYEMRDLADNPEYESRVAKLKIELRRLERQMDDPLLAEKSR